MSQLDDLKVKYTADLEAIGESVDADLLHAVAKGLGPSIYNRDSATVAGSDQKELDTVKNSFLIKKLGVSESEDLDGAIQAVIDKYGRSKSNKHRVVVYYLLTKHFGKESVYS